jgi:hypothetical protein
MVKQQFNQVSASLKRWNVRETAHRRNLIDCLLNFSCAFSLSHYPSSLFVAVVRYRLSLLSLIRIPLTIHRENGMCRVGQGLSLEPVSFVD